MLYTRGIVTYHVGSLGASAVVVEGSVDDLTFDRLARFVGQLSSRRGALWSLVGAAVAMALAGARFGTEAKKKKKKKKKTCKAPNTKCGKTGCCKPNQRCDNGACQGGCAFTMTASSWTLQRDCVIVSPIDLPAVPGGVTLDGAGHTIFMQGIILSLPYGIGADGITATVRNLTLDGSGLTSTCADRGVGIQFRNASGSVENAALVGFSASCGDAIRVIAANGAAPHTIDIDTVSIADSQVGINVSTPGKVTVDITNCDIQGVRDGIQLQYNVDATIENNEIAATTYGVFLLALPGGNVAPNVTATENSITGAQIGMSVAAADLNPGTGIPTLAATGNIIVGPGPTTAGATHGLQFGKQAAGSADDNEISNFFDNRANTGCGIFVAADAGVVDVGTNDFPHPQGTPPGNEQDECGVQ